MDNNEKAKGSPMQMPYVMVYVPRDVHTALKVYCAQRGTTMSKVLRWVIQKILAGQLTVEE